MGWIRRGRQLGQAVKNVARLRQILGTFAAHGFVDVVERMNLSKFLPGRLGRYAESQASIPTAVRLRRVFEELGPTFIKLGQLLSTRSDLLPDEYIEEFTKLQDNVQPLPYDVVKQVVESELKQKVEDAYSEFEPVPLASASIGQVHAAKLRSGERVVVKVQRPEIRKIIETDISLLNFLAGLLEKYVPEIRPVAPRMVVGEFFKSLTHELDYVIELNNMTKIAENLASFPEIVIPKVFRALSTHRVLTLEKIDGIRVNDVKAMEAAHVDRKRVVDVGARAFFKSVMIDGLFHGDLHGGNLFVLPGNKIAMIDFGIVGRLSQKSRDQLAAMVGALITEDYETLCYQYAELGAASTSIDFDGFQRDVRNALSPYLGLALKDVNIGRVLTEATKIATRYQIHVPGDWIIVFKAILTIEGMGRTLDPDFDLMKTGEGMIKDLVKAQYAPERLTREALFVAKDFLSLLQVLPRQLRWMLRKFSQNDFAIEIKSPDFEAIRAQLDQNGRRLSQSVASVGLLVGGALSLQFHGGRMVGEYPIVAVGMILAGAFFLIRIIFH